MTEVSEIWLECWDRMMRALYGGHNHIPSEIVRRIMVDYDIFKKSEKANNAEDSDGETDEGKFY